MIAQLAVAAAVYAIDKPYSYRVPEGMQVQPGLRVLVPFGRGNRRSEAVVLALQDTAQRDLKVIERALDAGYVPVSFLMEEKYLENQGKAFMERCPDELKFFNSFVDKTLLDRLTNVVENDFARVTYTEAVELLKKSGAEFKYPVDWGCDLQTEHERYLTEQIFKRPVFVTNYPKDIKAFYMRLNDDGKTVAAADCLVPGIGEIIGGSQREERLDVLESRIKELGMNPADYWWYCDLRRYGSCRHAGFGLGFERMVMYLTGVGNIRDVELHPRTVGNAEF